MIPNKIYRPDIDGLRAIAVVSVLLFHLEVTGFTGGYVGVDVFFVISGFLITRLIFNDLENKCFSFSNFYIRRVRRLFPALLFTLIFTLLCGYFLFRPFYYAELAESSIYALLSLSNFLFWEQSGYFDSKAVLKPLLHTWSLSVEEQFYLLWPLILVTAYRYKKGFSIIVMLVFLGFTSLGLSQYWLGSDPNAAFYLMPSRIFELCIGGMCLWICQRSTLKNIMNETLFILGLCFILLSVFIYDTNSKFPGVNALLPCLGAGMIILSGRAKYSGWLLRNSICVYIGRISYSLYLIHWPLYSFYRYTLFDKVDTKGQLILIVLSLILSMFMYEFVEKPFRYRKATNEFSTPAVFSLRCALISLVFVFISAHIWASNGALWRVNKEIRLLVNNVTVLRNNKYVTEQKIKEYPSLTAKNGLIIGDSHATDLLNAFIQNNPRIMLKRKGVSVKCQPMLGKRPDMSQEESNECDRRFLRLLKSDDIKNSDYLLLSLRWRFWAVEKLPETLNEFRRHTNAKIILFGPTLEFLPEVPDLIFHNKSLSNISEFTANYKVMERIKLNAELKKIAHLYQVDFVDKISILCDESECPIILPNTRDLIYVDYGHWSMSGAKWFGHRFKKFYPEIASLILN